MPVAEINTLVGEFVNVMYKYGHGSGKLVNQYKDYYNVVIGKSLGLLQYEIIIHFSLADIYDILFHSDIAVIILRDD